MIQLRHDGKTLRVSAPYSRDFVEAAHGLHGRWDPQSKEWLFAAVDEEAVRAALRRVYGWEENVPSASLRLTFPEGYDWPGADAEIKGIIIARTLGRDGPIRLVATVCTGGFEARGSRKHPRISATPGTVVVLRDVPQPKAEEIIAAGIGVAEIVHEQMDVEAQPSLEEQYYAAMQNPRDRAAIKAAVERFGWRVIEAAGPESAGTG